MSPYFGVLIIRILPFRVLYKGPLFSETPIWVLCHVALLLDELLSQGLGD